MRSVVDRSVVMRRISVFARVCLMLLEVVVLPDASENCVCIWRESSAPALQIRSIVRTAIHFAPNQSQRRKVQPYEQIRVHSVIIKLCTESRFYKMFNKCTSPMPVAFHERMTPTRSDSMILLTVLFLYNELLSSTCFYGCETWSFSLKGRTQSEVVREQYLGLGGKEHHADGYSYITRRG